VNRYPDGEVDDRGLQGQRRRVRPRRQRRHHDLRRALTFIDRIGDGVVKVNEPTTGLALQAPFGGFKQSSANTFKEQGPAALEFFTRTKTVYVTY
jgi:acyl-CoA reductase-like NAD-dependent aldehyde dehydrogenase